MARSNKYTSLNFNGVFEKKLNNNQSATNKSFTNQSKTVASNSRIHGHMLVLTRPVPKPVSIPQKSENKQQASSVTSPTPPPDPAEAVREPESISLRPQGRTGSGPVLNSSPLPSPVSPLPLKSDRFVPPHLRPGFVGKEEKPGPELVKGGPGGLKGKPEFRGSRPVQFQDSGHYSSDVKRPGSSGTRPNSSG